MVFLVLRGEVGSDRWGYHALPQEPTGEHLEEIKGGQRGVPDFVAQRVRGGFRLINTHYPPNDGSRYIGLGITPELVDSALKRFAEEYIERLISMPTREIWLNRRG